jgi:NAD(P)-dependent dehydrogenase (short-subunit alcohol dehydrogenase family)
MARPQKGRSQMSESKQVALVTGSNRGLGFETVIQLARKGLKVILTSRDEPRGQEAARRARAEVGEDLIAFHQLDVTDLGSVDRLDRHVRSEFGRLDALVNNAGVFLDGGDPDWDRAEGVTCARIETLRRTMEANVYGPLRIIRTFMPLMKKRGYGRIVNVSSGMGQLSEMKGGYPAYRISKTALNALTRIVSEELQGTGILINSACPGWVRTDMGGPQGERTPAQGADTVVWLATLPDDGPTGGFFRDRKPIPW